MYKIIGADGREYGPVFLEQLRQWLNEGRVNSRTRVLAEGTIDWKFFGDIPELAALLSVPPAAPPPTLSPTTTFTVLAADQVRAPAIFMIVLASLDIFTSLAGIALSFVQEASPFFQRLHQHNPDFPTDLAIYFTVPTHATGLAMSIICLLGAIQMLRLKSYGLAMAAAILMFIPCGSCCC